MKKDILFWVFFAFCSTRLHHLFPEGVLLEDSFPFFKMPIYLTFKVWIASTRYIMILCLLRALCLACPQFYWQLNTIFLLELLDFVDFFLIYNKAWGTIPVMAGPFYLSHWAFQFNDVKMIAYFCITLYTWKTTFSKSS